MSRATSAITDALVRRLVLPGALALVLVAALAASADAQDAERPRIVVAVMPSGDVPPGIDRDIQDLFLTALADQKNYDLVDRETVYELTELQGDVDLLLCVTRQACIEKMHAEHRFEHYVLIKVTELDQELEFTYVTFNYTNSENIDFGDRYRVDIHDNAEFVNRAFAVAEGLELKPVDATPVAEGDCARVNCPASQRCEAGRCVDIAVAPPLEPVDDSPPTDWLLIGGIATAVVGVGLAASSVAFYLDRQTMMDDLAASYEGAGPSRISTMGQRAARDQIDSINSAEIAGHVMLGVGLALTAAGAGLLTWALLDDDAASASEHDTGARLTLQPGMLPGGGALGATFTF